MHGFMNRGKTITTYLSLIFSIAVHSLTAAPSELVRISGSTTINPVIAEAAEYLRDARNMRIHIDTSGGSSGGINSLGDGRTDIAMASRPLNERDHKKFPEFDFHAVHIGEDAVSIVVSKDVRESGIHSISMAEMRGIYEGTIKNWKALGGQDRRIVFFNKEPGRGTWEVFVKWLYGSENQAPMISHPEVGANAEVRNKVAQTRGALSFVSTPWVDESTIFSLAIRAEDGALLTPTPDAVAAHSYPLSRPLYLITHGQPANGSKSVIDYLLSKEGQQLVQKHGYLALSNLQ